MDIQKSYYDLEPIKRLELFKQIYELVYNDSEIREDEESLDRLTELTTSLQSAITQINNVKEECVRLQEENKILRIEAEKLLHRDNEIDKVLKEFEEKHKKELKEKEESFNIEKARLIKEQIKEPLSTNLTEKKLEIPFEINNFVKLKIEDFRNHRETNLPRKELINIYSSMLDETDLKLKVFAGEIIKIIETNKPKITQRDEQAIMFKIVEAQAKEEEPVLDNRYR